MKSIYILASTLSLILISACTPLANRSDAEFEWEHQTFDKGYQETYRNLNEGFRKCRNLYLTSELYTDKQQGFIEIYMKTIINTKSEIGVGILYIDSKGESISEVRFAKTRKSTAISKWIPAFVKRDYSACQ